MAAISVLRRVETGSGRYAPGAGADRPGDAADGLVVFRWFGTTPLPTLSLPEQIAARVGDRIVTEAIPPGSRIIEQAIADEFRASRGPVREALRILEREGLVRIDPRHGARATQLSLQEVRDIFEIRAELYQAVARRLAEARGDATIRLLEDGIRDLRRLAVPADDRGRYAEKVFHLTLGCTRAAGNPLLGAMITSLALQTYRYSRLGLRSRTRRRQSVVSWLESLAAIRDGDAETAMAVSRWRILAARDEALRLLALEPGGMARAG